MMQQYKGFDGARNFLPEPRVALTDAQYADYQRLMFRAESLRAAGKRDEARHIARTAATIVQSRMPGLE